MVTPFKVSLLAVLRDNTKEKEQNQFLLSYETFLWGRLNQTAAEPLILLVLFTLKFSQNYLKVNKVAGRLRVRFPGGEMS